jgi:hypothetical protein
MPSALRRRLSVLIAVSFFVAAAFPLTSQAQMGVPGMDIKPGARAGLTFMTLGGDDAADNLDRRTGLIVGGFALVDFAGPFALQPELTYIQKGAENPDLDTTTKLDYIEIPVLAKFQVPLSGPVSPSLFAGPTLGFNVVSEDEDDEGNTQDLDNISGTEFGLAFGGGVDVGLSAGTLMVDVRYGLGLSNVLDSDADQSANNQGFMITAGFAF